MKGCPLGVQLTDYFVTVDKLAHNGHYIPQGDRDGTMWQDERIASMAPEAKSPNHQIFIGVGEMGHKKVSNAQLSPMTLKVFL